MILAAVAVIMLGQPAFARGGGFAGGFGGGFGGASHGFGGFGVHGFNAGFSPSSHQDGSHGIDSAKPTTGQPDHEPIGNNSADRINNDNTTVNNNFNSNHSWAANHPYEAAGAADYAWNHHSAYNGYSYAAYPYGYYGGVGVFPEMPIVIDNTTTQEQPAQKNNPNAHAPVVQNFMPGSQTAIPQFAGYGAINYSPEQEAIMHERTRVFAQELVGALNERETSPQVVADTNNQRK